MSMYLDWKDIKKVLSGEASPEEMAHFNKWRSQSSSNHRYFEKIKQYDENPEYNRRDRKQSHSADSIIKNYSNKRTSKLLYNIGISVAVALIAIVIMNEYSIPNQPKEEIEIAQQKIVTPIGIAKHGITIIKDDGTICHVGEIAKSNDIEVNESDNTIKYRSSEQIEKTITTEKPIEYHTISIPKCKEYVLILPDGTTVHLNAGSKLRYPTEFREKECRKVFLSGEGFFNVTHSESSRFVVSVENIDVVVYGTKFNINSFNKNIETVLVEGSVSIKIDQEEVKLSPNQKATVSKLNDKVEIINIDAVSYIAWIKGYFDFKETTIEDIATVLERWYDCTITFDNETVKKQQFSGYIKKTETLNDILKSISSTGKINFTYKNEKYLIW